MGKASFSKREIHNTWINLSYQEQQAAKLPAHLQASVVEIGQPKTP